MLSLCSRSTRVLQSSLVDFVQATFFLDLSNYNKAPRPSTRRSAERDTDGKQLRSGKRTALSDRHKLKQTRLAQYCPREQTNSFRATMKRCSKTDMQASTSKCDSVPTVVDLTQSDSDDEVIEIASKRAPARDTLAIERPVSEPVLQQQGTSPEAMASDRRQAYRFSRRARASRPLIRMMVDCSVGGYKPRSDDFQFSVMTYNILAQNNIATCAYLYKPDTHDPETLHWRNRWPLLMDEIRHYNADILCMQEVQMRDDTYKSDIGPFLDNCGYSTLALERPGYDKFDGCTLSFKRDKFQQNPEYDKVEMNYKADYLIRDNVAIIAALRPLKKAERYSQPVVVSTTHLLFAPERGDIKTAQLALLLARTHEFASKYADQSGCLPPIIYMGDFNMTPLSPMYELMVLGHLNYKGINIDNVSGIKAFKKRYNTTKRPMPDRLLPVTANVTDKCMTLQQYGLRYGPSAPPPPIGSGTLEHEQQLLSVYTHLTQEPENAYEVSTWHKDVQMVDYIFYSIKHRTVDRSAAFQPRIRVKEIQVRLIGWGKRKTPLQEDRLHILSRLALPSLAQLKRVMSPLPNDRQGSDHLPLYAKFALSPDR